MASSASRTDLARMPFVNQRYGDPLGLGLVGQVAAQFPVPPGAEFLILLSPFAGRIRDVAHIPDRQRPSLAFEGVIHNGAADLVLHVAQTPLLFRTKAVFHLLKLPPSAGLAL